MDPTVVGCLKWENDDRLNRRVAVISSVLTHNLPLIDDTILAHGESPVFFSPWKLDEYFVAVNNNVLFDNVSGFLDASQALPETMGATYRQGLVRSKYYFFGGNAHKMFASTTAEAADSILDALVRDGTSGVMVVSERGRLEIPSLYAPVLLAIAWEVAAFRFSAQFTLIDLEKQFSNFPAMVEAFFFTRLTLCTGVRVTDQGREVHWPMAPVQILEVDQVVQWATCNEPLWIKPLTFDHGGYNAIYLDKSQGLVRLIQIACTHDYELRLEWFTQCVRAVSRSWTELRSVEVFVVVKRKELAKFKFAHVSGGELMRSFPGWETNEEAPERWICF